MLTGKIVTTLLFAGATLAFADTAAGIKALDSKDYATAYRELKAGADRGNAEAEFYLGVMYARGIGVEQDISEAMRLYQLSAAQGNAQAPVIEGCGHSHCSCNQSNALCSRSPL